MPAPPSPTGSSGTLWWEARFPRPRPRRVPGFRPGHGARQAFFREDDGGPTITLPRRYRTKGVVLHELVHWALADDVDLPDARPHLRPAAARRHRTSSCGPERADGAPDVVPRAARCTSAGRRGSGPTAASTTAGTSGCGSGRARRWRSVPRARDGAPIATTGVYEGYERGASCCGCASAARCAPDAHPRRRRSGTSAPPSLSAPASGRCRECDAATPKPESARGARRSSPCPGRRRRTSSRGRSVLSASSRPLSSVVMMRAPVMPNGWPSAIAPPLHVQLVPVDAELPGRRDAPARRTPR